MTQLRFPCLAVLALLSTTACDCGDDRLGPDRGGDGGPNFGNADAGNVGLGRCGKGVVQCDGDLARVCDGKGGIEEEIDCSAAGQLCVPSALSSVTGERLTLGCVQCVPFEASCENGRASYCREDGSGYEQFECDPMQGMRCEPDGCKGRCAPPEAKRSYIGCDYYPTVTLNPVWRGFDFAISVANAGDAAATVTITDGATTVRSFELAVGAIEVVPLPWKLELKGDDVDACQVAPDPGATRLSRQAAYRLRSTQPVTVHQFSPLQYQLRDDNGDAPSGCPLGVECNAMFGSTDCLSYSNDASLLLPATSLTGDYTVMSWPSVGNTASFYAITATEDGTRVELTGAAPVAAGAGVSLDGSGSVNLDRGDVLQVVAQHSGPGGDTTLNEDTSGTRIHADKPVQVIGGHSCAFVPDTGAGECDHIEQALFPSQILGDEYIVSYPAALASESPYVLRVAAVREDTRVELDPAVMEPFTLGPDDPPMLIRVGAWDGSQEDPPVDVHIKASEPILIAQYLQGLESVPSGSGDPSMALAVPVAQYRSSYVFTAPTSYDTNFVNVIGPAGVRVQLDGSPLTARDKPVGSSGYVVFRVELPDGDDASHTLEADQPVGLMVYGYGRFTSYMYPGGLDLTPITQIGPQ